MFCAAFIVNRERPLKDNSGGIDEHRKSFAAARVNETNGQICNVFLILMTGT